MSELEFDFFEDETREAAAPVTKPRGPAGPPADRHRPLLRLAGLVALLILIIALPIGLSQSDDVHAADQGYLAKLSPIAGSSAGLGQSFAHLLRTSGRSGSNLSGGLSNLVQQQAQVLARAQALVPPPRLRSEHENALLALELRLSGLQGLSQALPSAVASHAGTDPSAPLAAQAARLLTADLVWNDLFRQPTLQQLAKDGLSGASVPASHFLADPSLAAPSGMLTLLQQLRGGLGSAKGTVLKLGDHGPAVVTWQTQLNTWLRATGSPLKALPLDGAFGPGTQAATMALQRARGLTSDGVVGPKTRRALQAALGGATAKTGGG
ncbi:MAG TPA: peptidoglycan-binding domain-containing protein [Gaiellaceae bacterium]